MFKPENAFSWWSILLLLIATTAYQAKQQNSSLQQPLLGTSAAQPVQTGETSGKLFNQGIGRTYYLYTPKSYQPNHPLPLVLVFHEYAGNGQKMAVSTGMNVLAEQKGFIVVYPNAIDKRWDIGGNAATSVNDVRFVAALIAHLSKIRAIDRQRIYATGSSNGGYLVQRLACELPSKFAAFASVAASLPLQVKQSCKPQTAVSMMMINGTGDTVVPWEGGAPPKVRIGKNLSSLPIPEVIDFWRHHDACSKVEVKQLKSDRVEISDYPNCQQGSEVTLVALKGGKHVWPGHGSQFLEASTTIWDFFQYHTATTQK